jgi:hypothetical protein
MSDRTLNDIMCLALVDGKFRDTLLTDVTDVVDEFDLDPEEQDILRAIKADSVTDFARKLHSWMSERPKNNGHLRMYGRGEVPNSRNRRLLFLESVE